MHAVEGEKTICVLLVFFCLFGFFFVLISIYSLSFALSLSLSLFFFLNDI